MRTLPFFTGCFAVSALLLSCAGGGETEVVKITDTDTVTAQPAGDTSQAPAVRLVVNIATKQLSVLRQSDTVQQYPIAVGKAKYPTPTGDFTISRIDFNPDWTPPDSEWAKDRTQKAPGAPGNPMGRARIVYQMPYTIHGTDNLESLGEAESHGSIRMANKDVLELARLLLKESGTQKPEEWYNQVLKDSTKMVQVDLNKQIPLTNLKK